MSIDFSALIIQGFQTTWITATTLFERFYPMSLYYVIFVGISIVFKLMLRRCRKRYR